MVIVTVIQKTGRSYQINITSKTNIVSNPVGWHRNARDADKQADRQADLLTDRQPWDKVIIWQDNKESKTPKEQAIETDQKSTHQPNT